MRSDFERLQDILQAVEEIEQYTIGRKVRFEQSKLVQSGVLYQLIIIGEAAGKLSSSLQNQCKDVPWKKIIGMRNILTHEYFSVDLEVVWSVVEQHLSDLKSQIMLISIS